MVTGVDRAIDHIRSRTLSKSHLALVTYMLLHLHYAVLSPPKTSTVLVVDQCSVEYEG